VKTRLMFVALSASVFLAAWGGALDKIVGFSDGS
jgi:hypothetical protein